MKIQISETLANEMKASGIDIETATIEDINATGVYVTRKLNESVVKVKKSLKG